MPVATPQRQAPKPRRRDAHNRRVRKVVAYGGVENSGDVRDGTTDYAYQGWRVLWENFTPEVMPFAPTGGPTTFVYGNYLDEVWNALESDGPEMYTNYYFLTGVNYSVKGVIDAYNTNALAEAYEYDPYGRHRVIDPGTDATYFTSDDTYDELHPGAINNAIRYTGQRFDAESGLMYYKNRYYDPAAGRFIGRDPLGWEEGPNRYGYVGGMPTMAVDPLGLLVLEEQFVVVNGNNPAISDRKSWTVKEEVEAIQRALDCFECSDYMMESDRPHIRKLRRIIKEWDRRDFKARVVLQADPENNGYYFLSFVTFYIDPVYLQERESYPSNTLMPGKITIYDVDINYPEGFLGTIVHEGMHAVQGREWGSWNSMAWSNMRYEYDDRWHEKEARESQNFFVHIVYKCLEGRSPDREAFEKGAWMYP